jgi:hypothetical protein
VLVPTHTTRHLEVCLASFACHREPAHAVVLTCDADTPAIGEVAEATWRRVGAVHAERGQKCPPLVHVSRPHTGQPRLNQVRNNGLRALDSLFSLASDDLIVILDGDSILEGEALALHAETLAAGFNVIIPYRVNLSERVTAGVFASDFLGRTNSMDTSGAGAGGLPGFGTAARLASPQDREELARRQKRYERQLWFRERLPAWWHTAIPGALSPVKRHKPKVIGGHHAVRVDLLRAVNGYDELFPGFGFDDDDLSQRLYMLKPKPRVTIRADEILAFHLWHPTRRPYGVTESPSYQRFSRRELVAFADRGWTNPLEQPEAKIRVIDPAGVLGGGSGDT